MSRNYAAPGVDILFAPPPEEIYRPGHTTMVEVSGLAESLEGILRPGHFRGVATVVLKLLNLVTPDVAYFGQKDYQQSLVVRRLVADLDVPVKIRVCPTVRDPDSLAMSSRNAYLTPYDRQMALGAQPQPGARLRPVRVGPARCGRDQATYAGTVQRKRPEQRSTI